MYRDQRWVLSVALALLSIAAGCVSASSGSGSNTGDASGSGVAADADEDSAAIADTGAPDAPDTAADVALDVVPDGSGAGGGLSGEPCASNDDCASDLCLAIADDGTGVCTAPCLSNRDCDVDEDCVVLPGTDAERVCVDASLCLDFDGDGVCNQLEILGSTNAAACNFNPAATESNGSCIFATGCDFCSGGAIASHSYNATLRQGCDMDK